MEDTRPLDYIEWGWIPSIRDFLHHIEAKIMGATQNPPLFREKDCYIMDSELLDSLTYKERMLIHRCRLFLQVKVLSDISNTAGNAIHEAWLHPNSDKPSYSLKKWPKQSNPGKEAWRIWKKFIISAYTNQNGKLRKELGDWTLRNKLRVHRSYCNEGATVLYT
jgi:hypothetical protein